MMMKAIRIHECGGPEVMRLEEVAEPKPGASEVVVRIHAAGVNPIDTYVRAGMPPYTRTLPYTPGLDGAGVVEAVGSGVRRCAAGSRVYIAGSVSGTYAEKALCRETQVHPLPEQLSYSHGAGVGVPYGTVYRALFQRAAVQPGSVVLVHGASGGVGIAALQIGRSVGMTVIGTAGTEKGHRLVEEQGAHHVLDHHEGDHLQRAVAFTDGRGVDVILEMLANVNLGDDLKALAKGGLVLVIGSRGTVQVDPRDLMSRDAEVRGMSLSVAPEDEMVRAHAAVAAGLESGALRPVVGAELPLADAAGAHRQVIDGPAYGKIVLLP